MVTKEEWAAMDKRVDAWEKQHVKSCAVKKRYSIEPSCRLSERAYFCDECQGWHKATRR